MEAENIVDKKELKGLPIWACILLFIVVFFVFMLLYSALIQGFLSLVLGVEARHPGIVGYILQEILKSGLQPRDINFLTIEGKLDNADFKLIRDYMPNLVSVDISRTNATAIPDFTFSQKKYLLRMKLPHNLKSIGQRVFSNCGRLCGTLELPASVTAIEFGAFMGCDNLRYVLATGNKITTLGDNLFGDGVPSKLIYKK
jgi:hypothetical protein